MARAVGSRRWALALWALCLLAGAAGHLGASPTASAPTDTSTASVGMPAPATRTAVLPATVVEEALAATPGPPLRLPFPLALLGALLTLPAGARRRAAAVGPAHRPLRGRRHAIALRAPPLQFT